MHFEQTCHNLPNQCKAYEGSNYNINCEMEMCPNNKKSSKQSAQGEQPLCSRVVTEGKNATTALCM